MRLEDKRRLELEETRQREEQLLEQNAHLQKELARLREDLSAPRPARSLDGSVENLLHSSLPDSAMQTPATSAIDLAFPPLQPTSISPTSSMRLAVSPSELFSPSSTPSSSSSSDLPTPTSPADPSVIPLPETPPYEDGETAEDATQQAATPQTVDGSPDAEPTGNRESDLVARELAETRAEADARDREIAELQEAIANLQHMVHPSEI